jgi:hypothetical protein
MIVKKKTIKYFSKRRFLSVIATKTLDNGMIAEYGSLKKGENQDEKSLSPHWSPNRRYWGR